MHDRLGCDPLPSLRRRLLHYAQAGSYWTGLARTYAWLRPSPGPIILMYHSVAADTDAEWIAPRNRMTPQCFERQMRFLARHRCVLSLSTLLEMISQGKPIPRQSVVLTFDDGYWDNLYIVAPMLQRHHLTAVLYLCTGYISRGENQWADVLYSAIYRRRSNRLILDGKARYDLSGPVGRNAAYHAVAERLLAADYAKRSQLLKDVVSQLEPDARPARQTLTWEEVRRLARDYPGFEFGVHTANHIDLSSVSLEAALAEVDRSATEFETEMGWRPVHFSFPYSRAVPEVVRCLREMGFRSVMTREGMMDQHQLYPMDLHRMEAPRSDGLLRYLTSGAYPSLSLRLCGHA